MFPSGLVLGEIILKKLAVPWPNLIAAISKCQRKSMLES
jgi:hypothetical protein